jgi:hypothetical protein
MRTVDKVKLKLTGSPNGSIEYQHEGPDIVRWITQGNNVSVYVLFKEEKDKIAALCPYCKQELGRFNADYGKGTSQQLNVICETANQHQCQK